MMLADRSKKYRRMYQRVDLPDRQWPNKEITKAPIWMSTTYVTVTKPFLNQ